MSTLLEKITELRTLNERATKRPWKSLGYGFGSTVSPGDIGFCHGFQDDCEGPEVDQGPHNAALIAEMRNTLKALLDSWQEQREALKHAAEVFDRYADLHMSKTPAAGDKANANRVEAEKARAAIASANRQLV